MVSCLFSLTIGWCEGIIIFILDVIFTYAMAVSIGADASHLLPWIDLSLATAEGLWLDGEVGAPSEEGGQRQSGCELFPKPASEAGTVAGFCWRWWACLPRVVASQSLQPLDWYLVAPLTDRSSSIITAAAYYPLGPGR